MLDAVLELYIYINGILLHIDDMLGTMQILLVSFSVTELHVQ